MQSTFHRDKKAPHCHPHQYTAKFALWSRKCRPDAQVGPLRLFEQALQGYRFKSGEMHFTRYAIDSAGSGCFY